MIICVKKSIITAKRFDQKLTSISILFQTQSQLLETDFIPHVAATCKAGHMNIKVNFNSSFNGLVHARDFRTQACMKAGDGSKSVTLDINLLALNGASDYCGLLVNNVSICMAWLMSINFSMLQSSFSCFFISLLQMHRSTKRSLK